MFLGNITVIFKHLPLKKCKKSINKFSLVEVEVGFEVEVWVEVEAEVEVGIDQKTYHK